MKICPTCRRTYEDDGLNFCLEDGSLLNLSSFDAAAPTIVMNPPQVKGPAAGSGHAAWEPHRPDSFPIQPKKKSSRAWLWVLAIFGFMILVCGGGFAGVFFYISSVANNTSRVSVNSSKGPSNPARSNTFSNKGPEPSPTENVAEIQEVDLSKQVRESSEYGTTEFREGELLMAAKQKGYYYVLVTPDDYKTEGARTRVTVRNPELSDSDLGYGLIFHSDTTPLESDYALLIDSKRRRFRVVRHEPGDEVTVKPWTSSKLINEGGAENMLEARDKGQTIDLFINGQLATTVSNKQGPSTGVPGLYSGDGAKIAFRKLEIIKEQSTK